MSAATTTTSKAASNRTNSIGGFYVGKISGDVMRTYLKNAEVPAAECDPTIDSDEALGVALTLYFREKYAEDDLCKCEPCGGEGPVELPSCAFCGLVAPVGDEPADETSTEQLAAKVLEEEPVVKKSAKKNTPAKEANKENEMQTQTNGSGKKNKGAAALATVPPKGAKEVVVNGEVVFTAADLDKSVERVVKLKSMAALSHWALGNELRKINEQKLWKLRVSPKGKAAYTSFDQFVETEAKLGHTHAYSLIEIATQFKEEDVQQLGTSKLTLMLKVAPEDRPAVREVALKTSKRQLAAHVAEVVRTKGGAKKKNPKHAAAGKKSAAKAKSKSTTDKITVASIEGRKVIKFYAKPDSLKNIDWSALKPAKTIDAQPFGRIQLTNEVSILISIVKNEKTGQLEGVAHTRRDVSE